MSLVSNNVFRLILKDTILDYDSINNILKILRETEQKIWIDENGCMKWIPMTISDKLFNRWKNEIVHRGELCEYYADTKTLYDERIDGPYGCEESMRIEFLEDPNSGHCCYMNMIGYDCNCEWIWRNGLV